MTNWFRMTPDGSLDREYLRICALYRCIRRYGMTRDNAIRHLSEVMTPRKAVQLYEIWT